MTREIQRLIEALRANPTDYVVFRQQILEMWDNQEITVPISVFSTGKLTILQALVLHLSREQRRENKEIAKLLSRSTKAIWSVVKAANKAHPQPLPESGEDVPVSAFTSDATPLAQFVVYCKEVLRLKNKKIAKMCSRDPRTISSVYSLAKRGEVR